MFEPEERRIARRFKDFIKNEKPLSGIHIMLRNGRILRIGDYHDMVSDGMITPQDAYVYFDLGRTSYKSTFYYPLLGWFNLLSAYLSKLGLYHDAIVFPATGLKYIAFAEGYEEYMTIELANLDTVANNTGLRKIVIEVLDGKLISGEKELTAGEYLEIRGTFESQRLFAGYNVNKAWDILYDYYDKGNKSLAKEVARIAMDYDRIFQPYRVCYETETWDEVDCLSIKL